MSFLKDNDHIVLMDVEPYLLSFTELKDYASVGARTVYAFVDWARIDYGLDFDWRGLDAQVDKYRRAGLRYILATPASIPESVPNGYRPYLESGKVLRATVDNADWRVWNCLSPWVKGARDLELDFVSRTLERYRDDDALVVASHSGAGESVLPPIAPAIYDHYALAAYKSRDHGMSVYEFIREAVIESTVEINRILVDQHNELWSQLHRSHGHYKWTGSQYTGEVYQALQALGARVVALQFTHFPAYTGHYEAVARDQAQYGVELVVGAEYTQGLTANTPKAIAQGIKHLICAPLHPYQENRVSTPEMVDRYRVAYELMSEPVQESAEIL